MQTNGGLWENASMWVKYGISEPLVIVSLQLPYLLVELNTGEEVKPLYPLHQLTLNDFENVLPFSFNQFWDKAFLDVFPIEDCHVPLKVSLHKLSSRMLRKSLLRWVVTEIFNGLMNVGRIAHPIRVSPKSFYGTYVFEKGVTLSTISFVKLNGCNKLLGAISLDYKYKDLISNPLQRGDVNAEQAMKIGFFFL